MPVLASLRNHALHGAGRTMTRGPAAGTVLVALLRLVAAVLFVAVVLPTHTVILVHLQRLAAGGLSFSRGGEGTSRQATRRLVGRF